MNLTIPEEFPISEKERQLIKKKLLMFLAWCKDGEACRSGKACPFLDTCRGGPCRIFFLHFVNWIMEAEID